ncbi:MAG TPA: S53 family peptidase [Kofleriaceae bacterium]|jgi:subtilase family serine protease|nr:S53 family peptidase [Kofleriaceae bacterium]
MFLRSLTLSSALVGVAALGAAPAAAAPLRAHVQQAQDLGAAAPTDSVTATLVLKVRSPDALEALAALVQQPGLPTFHHFLSTGEFAELFAPSQQDIKTIKDYLRGFGITVDEVYANRLLIRATGTTDAFNQAFDVDVHTVSRNGKRFHRAHRAPKIPLLLRDLLVSIQGVDTEDAQFHPMRKNAAEFSPVLPPPPRLPKDGAIATGEPGDFTVGDAANMYNINPLYDAAIDGSGSTIGIATLANFDPQDAYTYWNLIGLDVDQNRITQVHVDGGGELSGEAGSGETCLDVEQSGGLAPGAKVIVYDAPNTGSGFVDLFYKAVAENKVDSLSVSWGSAEVFYLDAVTGEDDTGQLKAFHQVFLEAGVQGISIFASAGDSGAYDINDAFNDPVNNVLTVDAPAADPAITAAGGTTTPVALSAGPGTPDLVVSSEQVWGWDYLENYLVQYVDPSFLHELFPAGGGGGVSVIWQRPYYQDGTHGIRKTEAHQSVIFDPGDGSGPQDLLDLPAHFAGRNVPDVSLDADPESGYLVYSTTDGGLIDGFGGTSFVAPQLNGITALLAQSAGGRVGFLNPALYRYKETLHGAASPLVDISAGDNWFYAGVNGYDAGAGLGVLNVANLAAAIRHDRHGH